MEASNTHEMTEDGPVHAWLVLAVGDDRQHGGNEGYDDDPAVHYSWDSTVPNHEAVAGGDAIVIWDKRCLVGASVIERIDRWQDTKVLHRCPECGLAGIKARKTLTPRFKCYKCKATFDVPISRTEPVTAFRSEHDVGWVDLAGLLSGPELRALCVHPASQLSIRPLRWNDFAAAVSQDVDRPGAQTSEVTGWPISAAGTRTSRCASGWVRRSSVGGCSRSSERSARLPAPRRSRRSRRVTFTATPMSESTTTTVASSSGETSTVSSTSESWPSTRQRRPSTSPRRWKPFRSTLNSPESRWCCP